MLCPIMCPWFDGELWKPSGRAGPVFLAIQQILLLLTWAPLEPGTVYTLPAAAAAMTSLLLCGPGLAVWTGSRTLPRAFH